MKDTARTALEASTRWYWRFWKTTELRLQAAAAGLDRLRPVMPELDVVDLVAEHAPAPRSRLHIFQVALEQVASGAMPGTPLPLFALSLVDRLPDARRDAAARQVNGRILPSGSLVAHLAAHGTRAHRALQLAASSPPSMVALALQADAVLPAMDWLASHGHVSNAPMQALQAHGPSPELAEYAARQYLEQSSLSATELLKSREWSPQDEQAIARYGLDDLKQQMGENWLAPVFRWPNPRLAFDTARDAWQAVNTGATPEAGFLKAASIVTQAGSIPLLPTLNELERVTVRHDTKQQIGFIKDVLKLPLADPDAIVKGCFQRWQSGASSPNPIADIAWESTRHATSAGDCLQLVNAALRTMVGRDASLEALIHAATVDVPSSNETWLKAAAGLVVLDVLRKHPLNRDVLARAARSIADCAWLPLSVSDAMLQGILAELQRTTGIVHPGNLREAIGRIEQMLRDDVRRTLLEAARPPGEQPTVEAESEYVDINGLRVARAGSTASDETLSVSGGGISNCAPAPVVSTVDPNRLRPLTQAEIEGSPAIHFERRSAYKSGVAGVYNPLNGQVEWKNQYKSGVAGVFDPRAGSITWFERYKSGVGATWDPRQQRVVSHEQYKSGVALVFDAEKGTAEPIQAYKTGVGAALNPDSGRVESQSAYKTGVTGFYDMREGRVHFDTAYKTGIGVVFTHPACPTIQGSSFTSDFGDDDD